MRSIEELLSADSAWPLIQEWASEAQVPCELLPPSPLLRDEALLAIQVTTHSVLGSIIHDTGGILIDDGWLRFLGSGHGQLPRPIHTWNAQRAEGFLLVADDVVGGFFAINGGALGEDAGNLYYHSPDALTWEALDIGFSDFFEAMLTERLANFYDSLRWTGWREEMVEQNMTGDQCFHFVPPLWTKEGNINSSSRKAVPVAEIYDLYVQND